MIQALIVVGVAVWFIWYENQMRLKDKTVNLDVSRQITYALAIAESVYYSIAKIGIVVTSARDSHESEGSLSLHNAGQAVDLRTSTLNQTQKQQVVAELKRVLYPQGFDVVFETNPEHIHIEYDPKMGRVFTTGFLNA